MKALQAADRLSISSIVLQQSNALKQLSDTFKSGSVTALYTQNLEAFENISQLSGLASFKALADLHNTPTLDQSSIEVAEKYWAEEDMDESLLRIDAEIGDEISKSTDFNVLSEKAKYFLIYFYHHYFLPVILTLLTTHIINSAHNARKELETASTATEVRAWARSSRSAIDRSALAGFRVTTANSLHFRKTPSMGAEILSTLPIGTLGEVVDKSRRSWLLVEVEIDGELEQGWIARRYTTYFR
jgi:hypothetical protein